MTEDVISHYNHGVFDKIVCDSYAAATGYLGMDCGNQNVEQRHRMFSDLVLHGKLREDVRFVSK